MVRLRQVLVSLCLLGASVLAWAQPYPTKPIRLIVPFPPGGPVDLTARVVGKLITDGLGQPVVIDNKSGAGGILGTDILAKAPGDGYTLGMGTIASLGINPALMEKLPFNVKEDFTPVSHVAATSGVILATRDAPFSDLKGLIAYARENPKKVTYASAGLGSVGHMVGESLNHEAGIQMIHVPYRGTAPAAQDLLAGNVTLFIETSLGTAINYLPTGKVKAIAVTRKDRSALLPTVPSMGEGGFPGIDSPAWFGLVGPANLPKDVVQRLHQVIQAGLKNPAVVEQLARFGAEPVLSTPASFGDYIDQEINRWKQVVKAANIKPQ